MKIALLLIAALVILGFIAGCNYDNPASIVSENTVTDNPVITNQNNLDAPMTVIDTLYRPLLRSNNTSVGTVKIYNNNDFVYFKFTMNQGYKLTKIRMHASIEIWSFPLISNCPNLNAFRFQVNTLPPNTTNYLYQVSTATFLRVNTYMFAAIYVETEPVANGPECTTAWAKGSKFPGCTGEGMHFKHWIQEIKYQN
jgi:hypothetical protein